MLFRSCAQGQEQELFQFEAFCALINVSTPKDTTILASPMLGTLDVALHEDSLEAGHLYRVKRSLLEALDKFEAVSSTYSSDSKRKTEKQQAAVTQNLFHVFFLRWPLIDGQPFTDSLWCVAFQIRIDKKEEEKPLRNKDKFVFF